MRFLPSVPFADEVLTQLPEVMTVEHEGPHIEVTGTGDLLNAVLRALAKMGVEARDAQVRSGSLEDAFVHIVNTDARKASEGGSTP
jgi:ABC-2 type transport system ATP-binding protein